MSTYHASDMCHAPANETGQQAYIPVGNIHRVLLTGLKAYTTYYYTYGNAVDGFSVCASRELLAWDGRTGGRTKGRRADGQTAVRT